MKRSDGPAAPIVRTYRPLTSIRLPPAIGQHILFAMRVIARRTLRQFVDSLAGHQDQSAVKRSLDAWFAEVSKACWSSASDIRRLYATASIVSAERVVFNIKGNAYRLIASIDFQKGLVWIKWIGSHRAYDDIDVIKVQHGD